MLLVGLPYLTAIATAFPLHEVILLEEPMITGAGKLMTLAREAAEVFWTLTMQTSNLHLTQNIVSPFLEILRAAYLWMPVTFGMFWTILRTMPQFSTALQI